MFVVVVHYKKPIVEIDKYLKEHREFLTKGYEKNYLIVSGPQNPRVGGVIISQLKNRQQLEDFLHQDPFYLHQLVEYEIIEFIPVKHHTDFSNFL